MDYRKIPREYLNARIPKGRGMVKWQAFKTVPEQYEILEQYIKDQNKIPMPLLSDCLLYTSPSPRDATLSRMPSSA